MHVHRGDIGNDFYDQFFETGLRIDIVGIACRKFMRNLMPPNGASANGDSVRPGLSLEAFRQTKLFHKLKERADLTVNACFLNPWAPFVKIRMKEEGNPRCRQHILDGIHAVHVLYDDVVASREMISGSLNIKLIERNPYLSVFRVQYDNGQPGLIRAGILVQGGLGMDCPEIPIKSNGPLRDVYRTLYSHIDVLQTDAHILFRWADKRKPEFNPAYPNLSDYHVLLLHNSRDKAEIIRIGEELLRLGKLPWIDKWALPAARSLTWEQELVSAIRGVPFAAVCVGPSGIGPWQEMEIELLLDQVAKKRSRIIPIRLPGLRERLPDDFLSRFHWVDLDQDWEKGIADLVYRMETQLEI